MKSLFNILFIFVIITACKETSTTSVDKPLAKDSFVYFYYLISDTLDKITYHEILSDSISIRNSIHPKICLSNSKQDSEKFLCFIYNSNGDLVFTDYPGTVDSTGKFIYFKGMRASTTGVYIGKTMRIINKDTMLIGTRTLTLWI